jgi:tRNA-Thr(GGU) m(6)t(6)A37 methyltransferase TsaA
VSFQIAPIGHVRGGRDQPIDDDWGQSRARIELDPARFGPEALAGLDAFSHLEVIFVFDRVADAEIEYGARHPRGRQDWPLVGIFAQRGKNRPNRLGLCTCRIVRVDGLAVEVEGLDAIDGTPVVDMKPAMREFMPRGQVIEPAWAAELMKDYW